MNYYTGFIIVIVCLFVLLFQRKTISPNLFPRQSRTGQLPGVLHFLKLKLSVTFTPWKTSRVAEKELPIIQEKTSEHLVRPQSGSVLPVSSACILDPRPHLSVPFHPILNPILSGLCAPPPPLPSWTEKLPLD